MEQTLFAWVHLSDIHVGHGDPSHRWDQQLVLREIARDVVAARRNDPTIPAPNAVLVTGDVAFSGNGVVRAPDTESREYERAKAWLLDVAGKLGLSAADVFVVPGNHDVDRGKDRDRDTARLVKALQGGDSLDEALGAAGDRKRLAERMGAYLAFAAGLAPACLSPALPPAEERLYWAHRLLRPRGLTVRLAGLNTALLSSGDADFGHLGLGREQIVRTLAEPPIAEENELVIALSHHPFRGWLADEKDAMAALKRHAHLHLSGHVHEAESEESRTGGARHGFLRVVAGAAHADKQASSEIPAGHGYNFAAVVADERGELRLRVWPRKWSDKNRDFRQDVEVILPGKSWAEHALAVRCAPLAEEGATRLPSSGPVRVYIAHAPKDAALKDELEEALYGMRREGLIAMSDTVETAHVVLLMMTRSYLANDVCYETQLPAIKARHDAGEAAVLLVLAKEVELAKQADFKRIAAGERAPAWYEKHEDVPRLPYARKRGQNNQTTAEDPDGIPVTRWPNADEAWTEIALEVREAIAALRRAR